VKLISDEHRRVDIVQCQLVLQDELDVLWPSNVYYIYHFTVDGVREDTFVVIFGITGPTWFAFKFKRPTSLQEDKFAQIDAKDPGTYTCQCHIYYCGANSNESHLRVIEQVLNVTSSEMSEPMYTKLSPP